MLRLLPAAFLLLVALPGAAQSRRHDLLRLLDKERFAAQVQKDSVKLNQLLAADLIYTHSSGIVETKGQFMHNLLAGRYNYQAIDTDSVTVRFYGPVAILTGRARVVLLSAGKPTPVTMVYTDIWHEQRNRKDASLPRWQLVSWAASRLPTP